MNNEELLYIGEREIVINKGTGVKLDEHKPRMAQKVYPIIYETLELPAPSKTQEEYLRSIYGG